MIIIGRNKTNRNVSKNESRRNISAFYEPEKYYSPSKEDEINQLRWDLNRANEKADSLALQYKN